VGQLGSGPCLVGRIESGVRVSDSFCRAMLCRGLCRHAVSVTFVDSVKTKLTNKRIFNIFFTIG